MPGHNGAGDLGVIVAGQAPRRHSKIGGEHQTQHDQNRIRNLSHLLTPALNMQFYYLERARFAESENVALRI